MPRVMSDRTNEILGDRAFKELVSARARMRWSLSMLTLIMFFGFIALISTARNALGAVIGASAIPLSIVLALFMIVMVVVLTGVYVERSNSRFDDLARRLRQRFDR
jgi:uncharacterized membrane protein (DUF485 family)